jgi:hypothetical protein
MADRDRSTRAHGDADEGFLRRWSRRKAEARSAATTPSENPSDPAEGAHPAPEQPPEPDKAAPAPIDPEDLPDIESLDANSDFTVFMRPGVPLELRNQALRKLWRSDPTLANLDGLLEYGEDYTIPSWPKGAIKTAYQIGRGLVTEIEKLGGAEARSGTAREPVSGPEPQAGPAVAAADPTPAAETPQLRSGATGSDETEAATRGKASTPKRPPRPLPRRG